MENPSKELKQIVLNLTENDDPVLHKATVDKYFLPTASFEHPMVNVTSGPNSIETLKQVYAVYKVFTKHVKIDFQNVTVDLNNTRAVIEMEESLTPSLMPYDWMRFERVKIVTILDLVRDERSGKYYISKQYDVFPLDKLHEILPFGFLYTWWQGLATITGGIVGRALNISGLW